MKNLNLGFLVLTLVILLKFHTLLKFYYTSEIYLLFLLFHWILLNLVGAKLKYLD